MREIHVNGREDQAVMHQPEAHAPGDVRPAPRPLPSVASTAASAAVAADPEIARLSDAELIAGIAQLREARGAVILAHNYQRAEIQDLADHVGDSLELARRAADAPAETVVLCGVYFMAETAAILCPDKRVLIPEPEAGCSLAAAVEVEELRRWKAANPDALIVAYINTPAAVKAEADYCVTSANAVQTVRSMPADREVLFLPDLHLGVHIERAAGRPLRLWQAECHVHAKLGFDDVTRALAIHPDAHVLLHPESGCIASCLDALDHAALPRERVHLLGAGAMVRHTASCTAPVHVVGTETGIIHRLTQGTPQRRVLALRADAECEFMKATTLPKLYRSLRDDLHHVSVAADTAARARQALQRMIDVD
ncbi:MAG: quinolinate synthase NadA [Acidimicrobiales bacterium]